MTGECEHVWAWVREMYRGELNEVVKESKGMDHQNLISFDPHSESFDKGAAEEVVVLEECRECGDRQVRQRATIVTEATSDETAVEVTDYNSIKDE